MTGDSTPLGGGNSIQPIHVKIILMAEAPFIYLCQIHLIYFFKEDSRLRDMQNHTSSYLTHTF